jgi:hypothetical protein
VRDSARVSPDNWTIDQRLLDRPGNDEVQLDLFYDYRTNVPLYPHFRRISASTSRRRSSCGAATTTSSRGRAPCRTVATSDPRVPPARHGHFALEERGDEIARYIRAFLPKHVGTGARTASGIAGGSSQAERPA